VVEYAPGVNDVEPSESGYVLLVKNRTFSHDPVAIVREVTPAQFRRTRYGLGIEVKRCHVCAQPAGCKAEQATSRTSVEERSPVEAIDFEHRAQRLYCNLDATIVEQSEENAASWPRTGSDRLIEPARRGFRVRESPLVLSRASSSGSAHQQIPS
jgi:hypothetical protein